VLGQRRKKRLVNALLVITADNFRKLVVGIEDSLCRFMVVILLWVVFDEDNPIVLALKDLENES
jgi:predicted site-specific integrase-resolvase